MKKITAILIILSVIFLSSCTNKHDANTSTTITNQSTTIITTTEIQTTKEHTTFPEKAVIKNNKTTEAPYVFDYNYDPDTPVYGIRSNINGVTLSPGETLQLKPRFIVDKNELPTSDQTRPGVPAYYYSEAYEAYLWRCEQALQKGEPTEPYIPTEEDNTEIIYPPAQEVHYIPFKNCLPFHFSSSDTDIATVSGSGKITAVSPGSTVIRIETADYTFISIVEIVVKEK